MGVAASLAAVGALAGGASSIAGLAEGAPATGAYGGNPNVYIPSAQPQADLLYQGIFNQMAPYAQQLPGQVIPSYLQYAQQIQQNPYAGLAQQGAGSTATADLAAMTNLSNAGTSILNAAVDPQQALYNTLQQQAQDQANATGSMYGISSSPYGAGVANEALQQFNIDWQNQQLQRQLQGIQGANAAYSGANLVGQAGAQLPYATYLGQQQAGLGALGQITGGYNAAFGLPESLANLLQSYMNLGQSATGLAQAGQAQAFGQQQILGQQLTSALTNPALASLFGGGGGGTPAYQSYNQIYGTSYSPNANDNYGYPGFDFSQAA